MGFSVSDINYQEIWDRALVKCWHSHANWIHAFIIFARESNIDSKTDARDIPELMQSLGLARWDTRKHRKDGIVSAGTNLYIKAPVRAMLAEHCPQANACLLAGGEGNDEDSVVRAMPYFKWKIRRHPPRKKLTEEVKEKGGRVVVRARSRDYRTNWQTVK